jgi:hypothetical protein
LIEVLTPQVVLIFLGARNLSASALKQFFTAGNRTCDLDKSALIAILRDNSIRLSRLVNRTHLCLALTSKARIPTKNSLLWAILTRIEGRDFILSFAHCLVIVVTIMLHLGSHIASRFNMVRPHRWNRLNSIISPNLSVIRLFDSLAVSRIGHNNSVYHESIFISLKYLLVLSSSCTLLRLRVLSRPLAIRIIVVRSIWSYFTTTCPDLIPINTEFELMIS